MPVLSSMRIRERAAWAVGPVLAILLVSIAIIGNSGPGFFMFALAAGALLCVGMPLMQLFIRRVRLFAERPVTAALVALGVVMGVLAAIAGAAVFNQW